MLKNLGYTTSGHTPARSGIGNRLPKSQKSPIILMKINTLDNMQSFYFLIRNTIQHVKDYISLTTPRPIQAQDYRIGN